MPHFANGTLAQEGDRVRGTTYNQNEVIDGTLIRITSEGDACNGVVQFDDGAEYPTGSCGRDWDYTSIKDLLKV